MQAAAAHTFYRCSRREGSAIRNDGKKCRFDLRILLKVCPFLGNLVDRSERNGRNGILENSDSDIGTEPKTVTNGPRFDERQSCCYVTLRSLRTLCYVLHYALSVRCVATRAKRWGCEEAVPLRTSVCPHVGCLGGYRIHTCHMPAARA